MIEQIIHQLFIWFIYPTMNHLIHNVSIMESNATGVNMTSFNQQALGQWIN